MSSTSYVGALTCGRQAGLRVTTAERKSSKISYGARNRVRSDYSYLLLPSRQRVSSYFSSKFPPPSRNSRHSYPPPAAHCAPPARSRHTEQFRRSYHPPPGRYAQHVPSIFQNGGSKSWGIKLQHWEHNPKMLWMVTCTAMTYTSASHCILMQCRTSMIRMRMFKVSSFNLEKEEGSVRSCFCVSDCHRYHY